jgi:Na+/phosphate symporter
MPALALIDSITQLTPQDLGCIAMSGSHGGISSARFAADARPLLSVFNDAGVGKDHAGVAGLAWLQTQGLAACAVAHTSACIGVAQSTLDHGIISHANARAQALGVRVGHTCKQVLASLQRSSQQGIIQNLSRDNA